MMKDYKLDVLGLSEMRWTVQGRLTSEDITIIYSGREEHHYQGVGILLNKEASRAVIGWKPVNERIITAILRARHAKVTVVQIYAPTDSDTVEVKDKFYEELYRTF